LQISHFIGINSSRERFDLYCNSGQESKTNSVDALFKHYWIINDFNHLYTNVGNNFGTSHFKTASKQLTTDGSVNDFASAGFGEIPVK
jgi:hypothetical protein